MVPNVKHFQDDIELMKNKPYWELRNKTNESLFFEKFMLDRVLFYVLHLSFLSMFSIKSNI